MAAVFEKFIVTPGDKTVKIEWGLRPVSQIYGIEGIIIYRNYSFIKNITFSSPSEFYGEYNDNNLTNGTTYSYYIVAYANNLIGSGPTKQAVPLTTPDAPTLISATPGNVQVTLEWDAPDYDGGNAITKYYIYINSSTTYIESITTTKTVTTLTDGTTALVNGTSYSFTVKAVNGAGPGESSGSLPATPDVVDPPAGLTANSGNKSITLTWTAPLINNGGSPIQYYKIYYSDDTYIDQTPNAETITYTVPNLTNGNSYSFYVTTHNTLESAASNTATSIPIGPAPTILIPIITFSNQNTLAYSDNGYVWKGLGASIFFSRSHHAAWNGTLWVAVGSGINSIAYSYDGINWTGCGLSILTEGFRVAWNGSYWLAGGRGSYRLAKSTDGINWTGISSASFTNAIKGLAWNGLRWVAAGSGGSFTLAYSSDGAMWTGVTPTIFSVEGKSVFWGGAYFLAAGEGATNSLAYSSDGISWTGLGKTIFSSYGTDIAWNGKRYVATGVGSTHTLAYSDNGTTWSGSGKTIFTTAGNGVTYNGRVFIAAGEGGANKLAISGDGINWRGVAQSELFTSAGLGVAGASGLGAVVPKTQIVLSDISSQGNAAIVDNGSKNQLDLVSDKFMDPSLLNIAINILSRKA